MRSQRPHSTAASASLLFVASLCCSPAHAAPRTVDYTWYSFFDAPFVQDAWQQREEVGFVKVRSFTHPVTHEATYVDGPRLVPGIKAYVDLYAPARLHVVARNLDDITINKIGGTLSPAAHPMGFLPYDLMGQLGSAPSGGTATLHAYMQFIDRDRANELRIPQQFGYHGWENEAVITMTLDRAAARKVLGIADADVTGIASWFASNEKALEQAWWWWLNDEGGDVHVGGAGRLDVRTSFNTPMQMWRVDFVSALYLPDTDSVMLELDWVAMASDILWSRWLREALGTSFEASSLSDLTLDMTIGPHTTDLDLDTVVDYALTQTGGAGKWVFEPTSADVPNLAAEYLNESLYESPGAAYADKVYPKGKRGYDYVPAAWNLRAGETLTLDFSDVEAKGKMKLGLARMEPAAGEFPGQIDTSDQQVTWSGPLDLEAWSFYQQPQSWMKLADAAHPDGLLPWGEPYVTLRAAPSADVQALFKKPARLRPGSRIDPGRVIPPFPAPTLESTPALTPDPDGRTLKVDLYNFLDVTMVADRWDQYDHNDYARVSSLVFPVSYQTTPYFSDADPEPFSETSSGLRMKVTGRNLPEIDIDNVGGGSGAAGFLPHDLMGGLEPGVAGGTAVFEGHLQYGTREREAIYRMQDYWGYYGWENFLDARITLDTAAAQKILGITAAELASFPSWFAQNREAVQTAWRLWLYEEWKRTNPMPWFNYPIQIWTLELRRVASDPGHVVLELTVLDEALDVLYGRWFLETFLPHSEASYDDMYLRMTIGPSTTDVDLDTVCDFALDGDAPPPDTTTWSWEPFHGDNPFLAHEYRASASPALPYYGQSFHAGQPDEYPFTSVPTLWNLAAGEQLNFHFAASGLALDSLEPGAADFPSSIVVDPSRSVSITGPVDFTSWSMAHYPAEWSATGGLVPVAAPILVLH